MVMRVQKVGQELHIVLTSEAIKALAASDGSTVDVLPAQSETHRLASRAEVMAAYDATEQLHRETYQELAK